VQQSDKGVVCRKELECFRFPLPPTGDSTCQKECLQNGDTCVLISIIVSGSEVDGAHIGRGGFRLLEGSCHVVVIYIMPYVMLHNNNLSKRKQIRLLNFSGT
jgi:hypothetical protein